MNGALMTFRKPICIAFVACCLSLQSGPSLAYERDVHYGLTKWLALKAGFAIHEAESIARGNERVDSGGPQAIDAVLDFGCALPDAAAALRVQRAHAPSTANVPAEPEQRNVTPGSESAKAQIERVQHEGKGKESMMVGLFGRALHVYQDSWSHAGVPSVIDAAALKCDANLASGHPAARGGWTSHSADLTFAYPDEAVQMARASYKVLTEIAAIDGRKRSAEPWSHLEVDARAFMNARTKAQKKAWFVAHGLPDAGLVDGISLPDGAEEGFVVTRPPLLPELTSETSNQYEVATDVRDFFDKFLATWISHVDMDKPIVRFLAAPTGKSNQLRARLKLLKMHDHGTAAALLHKRAALSASDLKRVDALTHDASAYARASSVAGAVLPLITKGPQASPLLPYITRDLPSSDKGSVRAIAILRLKHAPYDSVGLVAERTASGWKLSDVLVAVDH